MLSILLISRLQVLEKNKFYLSKYFQLILLCVLMQMISSCGSNKKITYLQNVPDSLKVPIEVQLPSFKEPKIKPDDILQVSVQTLDPNASALTGIQTTSSYSIQASSSMSPNGSTVPGFLVDKNGYIELPLVGKIKVSGYTTPEARDLIRSKSSYYYKDPVVNVRFANFNITVLGEVTRPAQYTVPSEKVSILDAIGMAGDLTIYGKRENVMLIREENGQKKIVRFDFTSTEMFTSPYFYLQQGDIIYVEPGKSKLATTDAARTRTYSVIISAVSVLVVLLTRINF